MSQTTESKNKALALKALDEHGTIVAKGNFRHRSPSVFRHGFAGELDCGGHPSDQGSDSSSTGT